MVQQWVWYGNFTLERFQIQVKYHKEHWLETLSDEGFFSSRKCSANTNCPWETAPQTEFEGYHEMQQINRQNYLNLTTKSREHNQHRRVTNAEVWQSDANGFVSLTGRCASCGGLQQKARGRRWKGAKKARWAKGELQVSLGGLHVWGQGGWFWLSASVLCYVEAGILLTPSWWFPAPANKAHTSEKRNQYRAEWHLRDCSHRRARVARRRVASTGDVAFLCHFLCDPLHPLLLLLSRIGEKQQLLGCLGIIVDYKENKFPIRNHTILGGCFQIFLPLQYPMNSSFLS